MPYCLCLHAVFSVEVVQQKVVMCSNSTLFALMRSFFRQNAQQLLADTMETVDECDDADMNIVAFLSSSAHTYVFNGTRKQAAGRGLEWDTAWVWDISQL